jgi:hypothetical protein
MNMATLLTMRCNLINADHDYANYPADFITLDLTNDYLIWSEDLEDHMTAEPTTDELNAHAIIIDADAPKTVPECLVMDYSHDFDGAYYTQLIEGMGLNKQYVFCFSFDGATANEPQLEAWDNSNHDTFDKNVLGLGVEGDSMIKAVCTTGTLPGASWVGTAIAGNSATRVVKLNDGNGALPELESGETSQELYANIKIVIPQDYATPAVESFILTVRYTWQ